MVRPQHQLQSLEYISSPPPLPGPRCLIQVVPTNYPHQPQQPGFYQSSSPPPAHVNIYANPTGLIPLTSPLAPQFSGIIHPAAVLPPETPYPGPAHPAQQQQQQQSLPTAYTTQVHLSQQISAEQQGLAEQEWIAARSQAAISIPLSRQEAKEVDEYNEFATTFRNHRLKLGCTRADVIQQVGIRYGHSCSLDTIARFELVQLPLHAVRELKPVLQMWLKDTVNSAGTSEEELKEITILISTSLKPKRKRKRSTNVDSVIESRLEEEFRRKRSPSQNEMQAMANQMGLEKGFIPVWFRARCRQQKRLEMELKACANRQTYLKPRYRPQDMMI